jgi:ribulose 1,5-bisphosphate synthetase/thiazole synthase
VNSSVSIFCQSHRAYTRMADLVQYDAIVFGSGQGGNPLAAALAKEGRKTALIEATHIGGTSFCRIY